MADAACKLTSAAKVPARRTVNKTKKTYLRMVLVVAIVGLIGPDLKRFQKTD